MNDDMNEKFMDYMEYLEEEEKSQATRQQYRRDITHFFAYVGEQNLEKELVIRYKEELQGSYQPSSVNTKIAAINGFFSFIGRIELKVKQLKIQRKSYCSKKQELTKREYLRLVRTAREQADHRLGLLIQTICGTGIRVSELKFLTAEAVRTGEAVVQLKGKTRTILISGKLRKLLRQYMRNQKIHSGPIFVTKNGKPMDRSNIWRMMKKLCVGAKVDSGKVFPHNLRHLFARCFYSIEKDIAKLADILGHSNINTTRIYILSTGGEHRRQLDAMELVVDSE